MKDNWGKKKSGKNEFISCGRDERLFVCFCFSGGWWGGNENGWLLQKTLINSKIPTAAVRVKTSFGMSSSLKYQTTVCVKWAESPCLSFPI